MLKYIIFISVIGYWYNIGIGEYSLVGTQDIRLYDISFLLLITAYIKTSHGVKKIIVKTFPPLKYFLNFSIWITLTLSLTYVLYASKGNLTRFLQATLYTYHLWGFFATTFFVALLSYKKNNLKQLISLIIILIILENCVLIFQFANILPNLWPTRWVDMYGSQWLSGTLGPNRVVPGMVTFFSFVFSLYISRMCHLYGIKTFLLKINMINLYLTPLLLMLIGSKTSFLTFLIFMTLFMFFNKIRLIHQYYILVSLIIVLFIAFNHSVLPTPLKNRLEFVIENRIEADNKKIDNSGGISITEVYEAHGNGRIEVLQRYISSIIKNYWFIITGAGVYSIGVISGDSAHNMYFTLIGESGLIGLTLYLLWLSSYIRVDSYLQKIANNYKFNYREHKIMKPFIITMALSLLVGEHLYIFRSTYAVLGIFLLLTVVFQTKYLLIFKSNNTLNNLTTPVENLKK